MRRIALILTIVPLVIASCSSSEPLGFDLARPDAPPPSPVSMTGAAVDEGVVCGSGMVNGYRLEDVDGNRLMFDDWGATVASAMESGTVAEMRNHVEIECDDGSGTITIVEQVRLDGEGRMSRMGKVEYALTQCTAPGPDGIKSEGTITFTARNGDELWLEHTMLSQLIGEPDAPPDGFTFEGEWTAVGGTGRYAHVTGSGTLDGFGDIEDGVAIGDIPDGLMQTNFKGKITRPHRCHG